MNKLTLALAALAGSSALATQAGAQTVYELDEIVVSGGLTAVARDTYTRAHSIVTGAELRRRGVRSVQEALRALPGVAVSTTDTSITQVRLRGGEGNHVVVLIDGVKASAGYNGEYYFSGLEIADVERIEVLRGPQSVIQGANASSGVISIITNRAVKPGFEYGIGAELGSNGSHAADLSLRFRGARGSLAFSAMRRDEAGYDVSGDGGERDGNRRTSFALLGDYALSDTVSAGFTLRRSEQEYDYDATSWTATDAATYVVDSTNSGARSETFGSLWAQAEGLDGRLQHRLAVSGNRIETLNYSAPGVFSSRDYSEHGGLEYRATLALDGARLDTARQTLSFAAMQERDSYASSWFGATPYVRQSRSVALEYLGEYDSGLSVQAGLRQTFNDSFSDATTWNVGFSYAMEQAGTRLHGSIGRAVVNPTMFEQFGYVPGSYAGNPDLKPETAMGYDLGAEWGFAAGRGLVDVTLFRQDLQDKIQGAGGTAVNLAGTSIRKGVEVAASLQATERLALSLNYSYTDARAADGSRLIRRPVHELGAEATLSVLEGRGSVTLGVRRVAQNYDTQWFGASYGQAVQLPDYTLASLAASYQISDIARLVARVDNLTDQAYTEVWGYAAPGRTAYLGVQTSW